MAHDHPQLFIDSLADLENWLAQNYAQKESVWLVVYKKSSGKVDFGWSEIVDVLLRFGWVDSLPRKLDDKRTQLRISPRSPKSNWSRINKAKIERLTTEGLMHSNGLRVVELAKQNGTWDALNDVENLIVPDDFHRVLIESDNMEKWEKLSRTTKRAFLEQLLNSKKQETRDKKIAKFKDENLL